MREDSEVDAVMNLDCCMQIDRTSYVESNEWELISSPGRKTVVKYPCCPEPYPDLSFVVAIQRIPIFYVIVLIIPCILLSLLTLVSFWLPPETPAKILLGTICLTTTTTTTTKMFMVLSS